MDSFERLRGLMDAALLQRGAWLWLALLLSWTWSAGRRYAETVAALPAPPPRAAVPDGPLEVAADLTRGRPQRSVLLAVAALAWIALLFWTLPPRGRGGLPALLVLAMGPAGLGWALRPRPALRLDGAALVRGRRALRLDGPVELSFGPGLALRILLGLEPVLVVRSGLGTLRLVPGDHAAGIGPLLARLLLEHAPQGEAVPWACRFVEAAGGAAPSGRPSRFPLHPLVAAALALLVLPFVALVLFLMGGFLRAA